MAAKRAAKRAPDPQKDRVTASISLMGDDRTGVVARVTQFLFEHGANIESLEEQVSRGFFRMSLTASWPRADARETQRRSIKRALSAMGRDLDMETRVRFQEPHRRQRMAILVTHEPHCLEALFKRFPPDPPAGAKRRRSHRRAVPVVVIGNRKDLASVAKKAGLPFVHIPWTSRDRAEGRLLKALDTHDVDFLVLARFMRILSPDICWRYRNKIINIHPSLLPAFPGGAPYRQAWEKGVRVIGATAHFVTPDLDQGPIIMQDAVGVRPDEGLEDLVGKGRKLEASVLLEAVDLYLAKRLDVHWGRVWET